MSSKLKQVYLFIIIHGAPISGRCFRQYTKQQFDDESLLIASLFHDIGLTEQHIHSKGCNCFTYESAKQFELKAKEHSFDEKKSGVIKDAICLHMNGYIDHSDPAEITLLQQGASCDVISDGLYRLPSLLEMKF